MCAVFCKASRTEGAVCDDPRTQGMECDDGEADCPSAAKQIAAGSGLVIEGIMLLVVGEKQLLFQNAAERVFDGLTLPYLRRLAAHWKVSKASSLTKDELLFKLIKAAFPFRADETIEAAVKGCKDGKHDSPLLATSLLLQAVEHAAEDAFDRDEFEKLKNTLAKKKKQRRHRLRLLVHPRRL